MKEDNTVDYMLNYAGNSVKINEALEAYTHKAYLTCDVSLSLCTPFTDTD